MKRALLLAGYLAAYLILYAYNPFARPRPEGVFSPNPLLPMVTMRLIVGLALAKAVGIPIRRPSKSSPLIALIVCAILLASSYLISLLFSRSAWAGSSVKPEGSLLSFALLSILTGYDEELFFRAVGPAIFAGVAPKAARFIRWIPVILFAWAHASGGASAIVTALVAGGALALAYLKFRNLHALAWAHAGYDFLVIAATLAGR